MGWFWVVSGLLVCLVLFLFVVGVVCLVVDRILISRNSFRIYSFVAMLGRGSLSLPRTSSSLTNFLPAQCGFRHPFHLFHLEERDLLSCGVFVLLVVCGLVCLLVFAFFVCFFFPFASLHFTGAQRTDSSSASKKILKCAQCGWKISAVYWQRLHSMVAKKKAMIFLDPVFAIQDSVVHFSQCEGHFNRASFTFCAPGKCDAWCRLECSAPDNFFCNVGSGALEQACPGRVVDVRCRLASASKTGRDADLLSRVLDSVAGGSFGQFGFFIRS